MPLRTSDFDYTLPEEFIAQTPIEPRDHSKLLVLDRRDGSMRHHHFFEITDFLKAGDVLVFNDSRVIPARLMGSRSNGGKVEILLLRQMEPKVWETLVRPGKRLRNGATIEIGGGAGAPVTAKIMNTGEDGTRVISFSDDSTLSRLGQVPLPPYIHEPLADPELYQTVYARPPGSVAAPTAGLHFTPELLEKISSMGTRCVFVTLHIGLDTFRPVHEEDPLQHHIHQEYGIISRLPADELTSARKEGRRIICVGTTSVRLVEAAASDNGTIRPFGDWVKLFIVPGHQFKMVDALITNFHLPRSTLLMLVSAFAGRETVLKAYHEAMEQRYRFYSFGDAMLIL